ncbi:MAG: acyltransferase [Pyrinomonadaceae bacterium]
MTANPALSKRRNINSLQALRGIAAVMVLLFHLTETLDLTASINFLNGFFRFANSGVEIFFVLSGFIIAYTAHHLISTKRVKEYILKRFIRVYPIYWIAITFFIIPAVFFELNSSYVFSFYNLLSTYLLFPEHPMIYGVSWSLSHEVYYYLLFALLIISRKFIVVYFLIFAVVIFRVLGFVSFEHSAVFRLMFSQNVLLFFMGMTTFYIFHKKLFSPARSVCITGITICIPAFILYGQNFHDYIFASMFYGLTTSFLIFCLVNLEINHDAKIPHPFILLGDASYVLYLIHLPILKSLIKLTSTFTAAHSVIISLSILSSALIIYASIIIHKKVEKPLLRLLKMKFESR